MITNYYHILGVSVSATAKELKIAYKKLAILYHPDKHQGNTYFEEKFKLVNEAYQTLSDPKKRANYDLKLLYITQLKQEAQKPRYRYEPPVREPASYSERHYRPIPKSKFSKTDFYIVAGIFIGILTFALVLKLVMDHITAVSRYQEALVDIKYERWSSAHSALSEAIHFKPKYADAYFKRAYIEMEIRQNYTSALKDLDEAINYTENASPHMFYLRGKCYQALKSLQAAENEYSTALALDKKLALAYYDRGMLRAVDLNKFPEAIKDFSNYLELNFPDSTMREKTLFYRGFCYYLTQHNKEAAIDYRILLQHQPKNARVQYLLGKAQIEMDSTTAACVRFNIAFNLGYTSAYGDLQQYCY